MTIIIFWVHIFLSSDDNNIQYVLKIVTIVEIAKVIITRIKEGLYMFTNKYTTHTTTLIVIRQGIKIFFIKEVIS